ncbi:MAG: alpha/beta fold hydrolase [Nitrospiraceae bacterium]
MNAPEAFAQILHIASRHTAATVLLASVLMSSCSSRSDIPPWFDSIHRLPIHTASVHGQRLAYLDQGHGPPVILLHGFGGSMWQWEYQQAALSARHRVVTLDLLGSGLSDKPAIDYSPDTLIEYLRGFMHELELERATLVGNSMGAGLAMALALTDPEKVTRLVLISGLPPRVEEALASPIMKRAVDLRVPVWLAEFGSWLFGTRPTEKILKEIVFDHTLLTPTVMERSNRNRRTPGFIRPLMSLRDHLPQWESRFAPRLNTITHSTLILWGEEDRLFPPQVGHDIHRLIPGSTLHLIPKAGHIPQWERPDIVNGFILSFLES